MKDMHGDEFPDPEKFDHEVFIGLEALPHDSDEPTPVFLVVGYMDNHGFDALHAVQHLVEDGGLGNFVQAMAADGDRSAIEALRKIRRPDDN